MRPAPVAATGPGRQAGVTPTAPLRLWALPEPQDRAGDVGRRDRSAQRNGGGLRWSGRPAGQVDATEARSAPAASLTHSLLFVVKDHCTPNMEGRGGCSNQHCIVLSSAYFAVPLSAFTGWLRAQLQERPRGDENRGWDRPVVVWEFGWPSEPSPPPVG